MVCLSTAAVAFADKLDVLDKVVGIGNVDHIINEQMVRAVENGEVKEVGAPSKVNTELLMELQPDLMLTFGRGKTQNTLHKRMQAMDIDVVYLAEYMENTPLGRAEWLKVLAALFNKPQKGSQEFRKIDSSYTHYQQTVTSVSDTPTVMVGRNRKGNWWVSGGNSYMAHFLQDAGAKYLWRSDTNRSSINIDFEVAYHKAKEADYWILNVGQWKSLSAMKGSDSRYTRFRAYQKGDVYNNNGWVNERGVNTYWEAGLVNPHWILADLIKIFHPGLLPEHKLKFYHRLAPPS
jgi:iron complex transport system substrate-binding protein